MDKKPYCRSFYVDRRVPSVYAIPSYEGFILRRRHNDLADAWEFSLETSETICNYHVHDKSTLEDRIKDAFDFMEILGLDAFHAMFGKYFRDSGLFNGELTFDPEKITGPWTYIGTFS